jgi:hypothetical protein
MDPTIAFEVEFLATNLFAKKSTLFPEIEPHPKPSSKGIENASLATLVSHLWGGVHDPPSPGPHNYILSHTVRTQPLGWDLERINSIAYAKMQAPRCSSSHTVRAQPCSPLPQNCRNQNPFKTTFKT